MVGPGGESVGERLLWARNNPGQVAAANYWSGEWGDLQRELAVGGLQSTVCGPQTLFRAAPLSPPNWLGEKMSALDNLAQ